jgi:hypothetical protein
LKVIRCSSNAAILLPLLSLIISFANLHFCQFNVQENVISISSPLKGTNARSKRPRAGT